MRNAIVTVADELEIKHQIIGIIHVEKRLIAQRRIK